MVTYLHDKIMLDPKPKPLKKPGSKVRVLFGKPTKPSETLSRAEAIRTDPYSAFSRPTVAVVSKWG